MTEDETNGNEPTTASRMRIRWYQRPTIRTLKAQAGAGLHEFYEEWSRRENEQTRLPSTEAVHLGGLVLTEAFTPSTVSNLYRALNDWPTRREDAKDKLLASLTRSRRGAGGGWQNFAFFSPSNRPSTSDSYHDPGLPTGVAAVWLHLNFLTPSLTTVVATFTIDEEAGELSIRLRQDYQTRPGSVDVRVLGRVPRLREKIPWARPSRYASSYEASTAAQEKARACDDAIHRHQEACEKWFFENSLAGLPWRTTSVAQ